MLVGAQTSDSQECQQTHTGTSSSFTTRVFYFFPLPFQLCSWISPSCCPHCSAAHRTSRSGWSDRNMRIFSYSPPLNLVSRSCVWGVLGKPLYQLQSSTNNPVFDLVAHCSAPWSLLLFVPLIIVITQCSLHHVCYREHTQGRRFLLELSQSVQPLLVLAFHLLHVEAQVGVQGEAVRLQQWGLPCWNFLLQGTQKCTNPSVKQHPF